MSPRFAVAIEAAYRAGRATLRWFQNEHTASTKQDGSPVTEADREAESLLRQSIESAFPKDLILGEEFGGPESGDRWILDPIDGTKSFVCGVPLYGTLVSYEIDGAPQFGVAYFPALDDMIYAELGQGCFWNGRPCRVSCIEALEGASIACGGHATADVTGRMDGILRLAKEAQAMRTWCDAYGHALVATGRIEAMLDPKVALWDISAMRRIVEEAGGRATDFGGMAFAPTEMISSNDLLHQQIVEAFNR